jgi:hypothetical protein
MRVKVKRKNGVITSFSFRAETDEEGVDLKNAVLAAIPKGLSPATVIEELERDYEADDANQTGA